MVEQWTENPRVAGSIPAGGTKYADVAHLVERHLAKVEVASSSLVIRSRKESHRFGDFFFFVAEMKRALWHMKNEVAYGYEAHLRCIDLFQARFASY